MIINLTQHPASAEQLAAGVIDLPGEARSALIALLTFETLPPAAEIASRARVIARLASQDYRCDGAMIGGAPFLMAPLEVALKMRGITPLYAFSVRESVEAVQPDGSVRKTAVFRHLGFVGGDV